jgi:hypothetical protein
MACMHSSTSAIRNPASRREGVLHRYIKVQAVVRRQVLLGGGCFSTIPPPACCKTSLFGHESEIKLSGRPFRWLCKTGKGMLECSSQWNMSFLGLFYGNRPNNSHKKGQTANAQKPFRSTLDISGTLRKAGCCERMIRFAQT